MIFFEMFLESGSRLGRKVTASATEDAANASLLMATL
jgi:hypothetical protein